MIQWKRHIGFFLHPFLFLPYIKCSRSNTKSENLRSGHKSKWSMTTELLLSSQDGSIVKVYQNSVTYLFLQKFITFSHSFDLSCLHKTRSDYDFWENGHVILKIPLPGLNFFWKKGRFCSAILCISTSFVEDFKCVPLKVVSSQGINFMCKIFDNKNWSVLMTNLLINLCTNLAQCKSS